MVSCPAYSLLFGVSLLSRNINIGNPLLGLLISLLGLTFSLMVKKVKTEDKFLFDQLKSQRYSTWLFKPTVGNKVLFVPFFSLSFLVISLLIIKLVKLVI